jgi:hypothetical protein
MTDLEITRLVAEAMGITEWLTADDPMVTNEAGDFIEPYDPLHDDAQCMQLVKRFNIALGWNDPGWGAFRQDTKRWVNDPDLNRAICECVANMQAAK